MAYETILTNTGLQKLASATPEHQLKINRVAVGDGNGGYSPLDPDMTGLVNEVWRGPASAPIRDREDPTILIFEAVIPPNIGGFFIREVGIFDDTGDMIAIGQTAVTEKPQDTMGTALSLTIRFRMKLSNASETELIYNDQPPIDHEGLTNRDAPDSHPIGAITGLNNALSGKVDKSTFVFAGDGLAGGGSLGANITLSLSQATKDSLQKTANVQSATPENGGLLVDNKKTGAGFERVLTESDLGKVGGGVKLYQSTLQMVADEGLVIGDVVRTLEHTAGYGYEGGNLYKIVAGGTGTHDNGSYIDLDNGLQAMGLFPNGVGVKQFGAGAGDQAVDQPAFEAALAFSRNVRIDPNPTPYVLDRLDVPSHTTLYGVGDESKILLAPGDKGDTDALPSAAIRPVGKTKVVLRDFYVDGNKENVSGTNTRNIECINFDSCTDCRVYRIKTVNALADGIDWDNCTNCRAIDCYGEDCGGFAVHISEGSTDCRTIRCEAVNCGHDASRGGFDVYSTAHNSFIEDCVTRACYVGVVVGTGGSTVTNHTSEGDINGGIVLSGVGARAVGGTIRNTEGNGLRMEGARASAYNVQIYGCKNGVRVTAEDCSLVGVRSRSNSDHGISIAPSVTSIHAVGCVTTGNAEGSSNAPSKIQGAGNVP